MIGKKTMPDDADVPKGLATGIAGGLLASLVMKQFQVLQTKPLRRSSERVPESKKKNTKAGRRPPLT